MSVHLFSKSAIFLSKFSRLYPGLSSDSSHHGALLGALFLGDLLRRDNLFDGLGCLLGCCTPLLHVLSGSPRNEIAWGFDITTPSSASSRTLSMPPTRLSGFVYFHPVAEFEEVVTDYSGLLEAGLVDPLPSVVVISTC